MSSSAAVQNPCFSGVSKPSASFSNISSTNVSARVLSVRTLAKIQKLQVDGDTYTTIGASSSTYTLADGNVIQEDITKETLSYYDYENELNESKRTIRLLKPEFIPAVEKEFKKVIKG